MFLQPSNSGSLYGLSLSLSLPLSVSRLFVCLIPFNPACHFEAPEALL